MNRDVIIGVDGGTGSIRVCLYDLGGNALGVGVAPYDTSRPHNGWAEQAPRDWWNALKTGIRTAMEKARIPKERILGLSTATTCCSVVLCMRDGTPLRDSVIWMDVRASDQAERIADLTGEHLSAEWMPCKLLWLKEHERENFEKAEVFCEYQDWMTHMLTGLWSVNINTACNWGYDCRKGGFPADFYRKIGIPEAVDKFPSDHVYAVGDKIAYLSPFAAGELGLDTETIVAQGGIDSSVGVLGMGVYEKGKAALMTGSSNLLMVLVDDPVFNDSVIMAGPDHLIKGYYTAVRGQVSSGSIISWFKNEFCKELPEETAFETLNAQALSLPVGAEGLLVLDYWQGNRQPYYDTKVRGLIYGYSLNHTHAHVYRALMEGVAFGTENLFLQFRKGGIDLKEISVSGGTVNSDLFLQIHADVSNVRVKVPKDRQSVCLGTAICVAAAAGVYDSLQTAVQNMVRYEKIVEPNEENHKVYQQIFQQYACLYPQMKDWMHKTTEICLRV